MLKTFVEKCSKYTSACPVLFMLGCVGLAVGVLNDSDLLQTVSSIVSLLALVLMLVFIVVALAARRFFMAFTMLLTAIVCLVIGFLTFIMIGVGQHHPPREPEDYVEVPVEWNAFSDTDREYSRLLGPTVEKGSWWTDGNYFYQVKQTGKTIRMEGGSLHEGGGVCCLRVVGDTALCIAPSKEGYTTFAELDRRVTHHLLESLSGDSIEVLVAYDADGQNPVAVLQRFDGDELQFEFSYLHQLLAGTYEAESADENHEQAYGYLQFHDDGTVQLSADEEPRLYQIELAWHSPTDVLRLPDGVHVGLKRNNSLHVSKAHYDRVEEQWVSDDEEVAVLSAWPGIAFLRNRPFALCAMTILTSDILDAEASDMLYQDSAGEFWPIPSLNSCLLRHLLKEQTSADDVNEETAN